MERMVRTGELAISNSEGDVLTSLGLGSCIGLAVVDRRAGAAGLAHIVLPGEGPQPKFAGTAVPALIDGLIGLGASRLFMNAYLVGGASMFASVMDVGARNAASVRELLADRRVPIAAQEVGGSKGRTIRVDVASGAISVRQAGGRAMAVMT